MDRIERLKNRIRRLFALADKDHNPHDHEAEAAMLKAQLLLAQEGWTEADVTDGSYHEKEVAYEYFGEDTSSTPWWTYDLAHTICPNFRVDIIRGIEWLPKKNGRGYQRVGRLKMLGLKQDVEAAREVLQFAIQVFRNKSRSYVDEWYRKNHPGMSRDRSLSIAVRNDYFRGFNKGLKDAFQRQVEEYALVLVKDQLVKDYRQSLNLMSGGYRNPTTGAGSRDAWQRGYEDGKRFRPGRQAIS